MDALPPKPATTIRTTLLILACAALLHALVFDVRTGAPDEASRWSQALELARRGPAALVRSLDTSRYPPLTALAAAPAMRIGLALDGGQEGRWTRILGLGTNSLWSVLLVGVFLALARRVVRDERAAVLATLAFLFTDPVLPYAKRFYSEPLSSLLVLVAFTGLAAQREGRSRGWLVAGLGAAVLLPLNNLLLPPFVFVGLAILAWRSGRRDLVRVVVGTAVVAVAVLAAVSLVRSGGRVDTGYSREHFVFKIHEGLAGLIFGPGRSVFLFAPLLFLAVPGWRRLRAISPGFAEGSLVTAALALVATSAWWCWWGGICWGPRLALPVLPLASVAAVPIFAEASRWRRIGVPVVVAFGLYVQAMGVAFQHDFDVYFWMRPDGADEWRAWFDPTRSVLARMPLHFRDHPWDLSSVWLTTEPTGASRIDLDSSPIRRVRVEHRGAALMSWWSVRDAWAIVGGARHSLKSEGITLRASRGEPAGATDGDPGTRWTTGFKRQDGDWLEFDFGRARTDVTALELDHLPDATDFPNALEARVRDDGTWRSVPADAAEPRLSWRLTPLVLAALLAACVAFALRLSGRSGSTGSA